MTAFGRLYRRALVELRTDDTDLCPSGRRERPRFRSIVRRGHWRRGRVWISASLGPSGSASVRFSQGAPCFRESASLERIATAAPGTVFGFLFSPFGFRVPFALMSVVFVWQGCGVSPPGKSPACVRCCYVLHHRNSTCGILENCSFSEWLAAVFLGFCRLSAFAANSSRRRRISAARAGFRRRSGPARSRRRSREARRSRRQSPSSRPATAALFRDRPANPASARGRGNGISRA